MEHKFDRDVPVPPISAAGGRAPKYPFKEMTPGDSMEFLVIAEEAKRIQRAVAAFARRNKVKMVTRRNKAGTGIRVWRME